MLAWSLNLPASRSGPPFLGLPELRARARTPRTGLASLELIGFIQETVCVPHQVVERSVNYSRDFWLKSLTRVGTFSSEAPSLRASHVQMLPTIRVRTVRRVLCFPPVQTLPTTKLHVTFETAGPGTGRA